MKHRPALITAVLFCATFTAGVAEYILSGQLDLWLCRWKREPYVGRFESHLLINCLGVLVKTRAMPVGLGHGSGDAV